MITEIASSGGNVINQNVYYLDQITMHSSLN